MSIVNVLNATYDEYIGNVMLNSEESSVVPLKTRLRQWCSVFALVFNTVLEVLARGTRHEE